MIEVLINRDSILRSDAENYADSVLQLLNDAGIEIVSRTIKYGWKVCHCGHRFMKRRQDHNTCSKICRFGTLNDRFLKYIEIDTKTECWNWVGRKTPAGYGQLMIAGKLKYAHRVSVILSGRSVNVGQIVCHSCDNPSCVNPQHLIVGNQSKNMIDAITRGRRGLVKLSVEKIPEIRKLISSGLGYEEIGRRYSVTGTSIAYIDKGKTWAHVK